MPSTPTAEAILAGDRRALAKAITLVESQRNADRDAAQALLGKACNEGNLDAVKRAVAAGADPNKRARYEGCGVQSTAALVAAYHGNVRELRFLLAAVDADPNRSDRSGLSSSSGKDTPCFWACAHHHHDCVRVLLALGATPDHSMLTGDSKKCTCPGDIARR